MKMSKKSLIEMGAVGLAALFFFQYVLHELEVLVLSQKYARFCFAAPFVIFLPWALMALYGRFYSEPGKQEYEGLEEGRPYLAQLETKSNVIRNA